MVRKSEAIVGKAFFLAALQQLQSGQRVGESMLISAIRYALYTRKLEELDDLLQEAGDNRKVLAAAAICAIETLASEILRNLKNIREIVQFYPHELFEAAYTSEKPVQMLTALFNLGLSVDADFGVVARHAVQDGNRDVVRLCIRCFDRVPLIRKTLPLEMLQDAIDSGHLDIAKDLCRDGTELFRISPEYQKKFAALNGSKKTHRV